VQRHEESEPTGRQSLPAGYLYMARIDDGLVPMFAWILVHLQRAHPHIGRGSQAVARSSFARESTEVLEPKYNQEVG
jgi:hypothetical protein